MRGRREHWLETVVVVVVEAVDLDGGMEGKWRRAAVAEAAEVLGSWRRC